MTPAKGKPSGELTFAAVDSEAGLKAALSGSRPDIVMKLRDRACAAAAARAFPPR